NSEWIRDSILGVILQYRMQEQKPTFFTSNQDFAHLEKHLENSSKGNIEPLKAKRIMERVKYLSEEVRMDGENKRNQF
ncbi:MAG: primosomal protein DnaI, partial [Streptococcaceae bacterium]|nr:primosomal protein DnaI [Streptococcaceae bacterium]